MQQQRLILHDEVCKRVVNLAPDPIAVRILEVLKNKRTTIQNLTDIITKNPLLTARILILTNFTIDHRKE